MVNKDFHFSVLTDNCQAEHHDWSIEKDCWRSFPGESSVISLNSFRSSANNEFFTVPQHTSAIYLINKMKSMGPRTEPCGTPLWTLTQLEEQFSMTTHWLRSDKNAQIHDNKLPLIPKVCNFTKSLECNTLSNAREKSIYIYILHRLVSYCVRR